MKRASSKFSLSDLHKIRTTLILCLFILGTSCLWGITAEYSIKSLGMKVANISISMGLGKLEISANSNGSSPLFPKINNRYYIEIDDQYRPLFYTRSINQKSVKDEITSRYNRKELQLTLHRKSTGISKSYPIHLNSRDVFSMIALLISGKGTSNSYQIDANGSPWQATITSTSREEVKTKIKKFKTKRYDIVFKPLSDAPTNYVDMVTHNFVNEDTKLSLWVADEGLAVKSVVKKKGISMNWELLSYHQ